MDLSIKDRLMLVNQFLILEKLYPEEATTYAEHRKALEEGYTLHYDWIVGGLYEELSEEECREVLDIMDMFSAIKFAYQKLRTKENIEQRRIKFQGFDGNNETQLMTYAQYLVYTLHRFEELAEDTSDRFNSHMPSLPRYRRMLAEWMQLPDRYSLSEEEIGRIAAA